MTLTYVGPTIGDGDLIVPAAQEAALDPLLAEALVLLRASEYVGSGDWINEGTAGGDAVGTPVASDNDVPPVWFSPDDGMGSGLRGLSVRTNETDALSSLFSTPDSVALDITGDITLRARFMLIPPAFDAQQGVIIRKTVGTGNADYVNSVWSLVLDENGDLRFNFNTNQNAAVTAGLSNYGYHDVAMDYDSATGDVRAFIADPDGDLDIDGDSFTLIGTNTALSGAALDTSDGPLTFMIAKGFGALAQVFTGRVGETMVKVAEFDSTDASGQGDQSWAAGTGETWTAGIDSWIIDPDPAGWWMFPSSAAGAASTFTVADDPAIDLGTSDGTIALWITPTAVATANFSFWIYAQKASGTGSGDVGWAFEDFKFDGAGLDGFGPLVSDGTDQAEGLHNASWTANAGHLAVTTLDRDGSLTSYVDGVSRATSSMTAGPGAIGDISTSTGIVIGGAPQPFAVHAFALYGRVLTPTEATVTLAASLGA